MKCSRRTFLGTSLAAIGAPLIFGRPRFAAAVDPDDITPLRHIHAGGAIRPPGALPEDRFRAHCIGCGICVNVCRTKKFDALTVSSEKGRGFGMPTVSDLRDFPCTLCMECPPRCPTGALSPVDKEAVTMGMALVDFSLCFGWNGDVCLSCSKACPLGAKVFDFHYGRWGNQPYINDKCVGCGLCVKYCPLGGSAIKVITRDRYQDVKSSYLGEMQTVLELPEAERYQFVYERNLPRILARGRLVEREYR